ncbi:MULTISPECIES: zonular occludens toxin domain-containing protein [unclassified Sulfurospirillum]|uniref:zonular occludens toxin domain-containing protein n=1 Tax=unclassified Sulfurospirillum TaxID=2618290 RepID=UPI00068E4FA4|nr:MULTISPECIES: zonular occludens toxin domain-containing protein [unclassified Sulfurospirillum]
MFSAIVGRPRSGKTYKLVHLIVEEFKKHKKGVSPYRFIYTNINGFLFDSFDGFVKRYNKADFDNAMQQEFGIYTQAEQGLIDYGNDYDKWAIENGVYADYHHCLIIIDEAYGTFTKTLEDHKNRFLSYHGHWGIDVFFILQSKRQINRTYFDQCDIFLVTKSSAKRLNSKIFSYKVYSTSEVCKDNFIEDVSLTLNKDIYNFYNSGSTVLYKSFVLKKLMPLFFLIPALYFYFFFFGAPKVSKDVPQNSKNEISKSFDLNYSNDQNISKQNTQSLPIQQEKPFLTEGVFLRAFCYSTGCRFENYSIVLGEKNMLKIVNIYKCEIVLYETLSANFAHYYLRCNPAINEFLLPFKERSNEANIANDSPVK